MLHLVVHLLMNIAILRKKIQLSIKRTYLYITLRVSKVICALVHAYRIVLEHPDLT